MSIFFRRGVFLAALISALALAVLSLVPGSLRPHTGLCGPAEHFIAYAGAGLLYALCVASAWRRLLGLFGFAVAACAFEALQMFVPDRNPAVFDALSSTAGAALGISVGVILSATVAVLARAAAARRQTYVIAADAGPSCW
jgi:hypothetical protein